MIKTFKRWCDCTLWLGHKQTKSLKYSIVNLLTMTNIRKKILKVYKRAVEQFILIKAFEK